MTGPDEDAGPKSIAVLPFVNMSGDADNEYFSDGLSEELLNLLAQVDGLRVAARTSSFFFKGQNEDLRSVGDKLGVEHVLEGSVRKSGNRIRVTAQLIKVNDGFHLWSDTYDYEMDDIFKIQDEISLAVVDALKVNLLGEERQRITKRATTNVEAHNLYLRGRQFLHLRTLESVEQAEKLFEQAVRMDPNYALAYSGLADAVNLLCHQSCPDAPGDRLRANRAAAGARNDPRSRVGRGLGVKGSGGAEHPQTRRRRRRRSNARWNSTPAMRPPISGTRARWATHRTGPKRRSKSCARPWRSIPCRGWRKTTSRSISPSSDVTKKRRPSGGVWSPWIPIIRPATWAFTTLTGSSCSTWTRPIAGCSRPIKFPSATSAPRSNL